DLIVGPSAPPARWEIKMLPMDQIKTTAAPPEAPPPPPTATPTTTASNNKPNSKKKGPPPPPPTNTPNGFQRANVNAASNGPAPASQRPDNAAASDDFSNQSAEELNKRAADGFLINGSSNNAATSAFSLGPAFGNNRRGLR